MEDKLEKHLEEFQKITTELTSASKYEMDLYLAIFKRGYSQGVIDLASSLRSESIIS